MLVLSRKQNQTIQIGNDVVIHVCRVKGAVVRLGIEAPHGIRILRGELPDWSLSSDDQVSGPDLGHPKLMEGDNFVSG